MLRHVAQRYLQHSLPANSSGRPLISAVHDLRIASYSSSDERELFLQDRLPSSPPLHEQLNIQRVSSAVDLVSWQAPPLVAHGLNCPYRRVTESSAKGLDTAMAAAAATRSCGRHAGIRGDRGTHPRQ
jgi:hypothetical protein